MRKLLLSIFSILVLSFSMVNANASETDDAADVAEQFIGNVVGEVKTVLDDSSLDDDGKIERFITIIDTYVYTDWMAQFALGDYRKDISDSQKEEYLNLYRDFVIYNYLPKFKLYNGETVSVKEVKGKNGKFTASMVGRGTDGTELEFDIRLVNDKSADKLKFVDVVAEGVSVLATQKNDFNNIIKRKGMSTFIKLLTKKVAKLRKQGV